MPWKEETVMDQRAKLAAKWRTGNYSVLDLAQEFGVSRPTVYALLKRLESGEDLSYRAPIPKTFPHRTAPEVEARIVREKERHPLWGPKKLIDVLLLDEPEVSWPAPSTAGRILDARGLVRKRKPRRNNLLRRYVSLPSVVVSGEMMTGDHKGQIRMNDGCYSYPLTVCDPESKFVYAVDGRDSTSFEEAKKTFEQVFKEYGVPRYILTDNGNPFSCSRSLGGLSKLAVWWIKVGCTPLTIHKGAPWENGSHERMHRDLKDWVRLHGAPSRRPLQKTFDRFKQEFNFVRPHESLQGRRPADLLRPCKGTFPRKLSAIEYPFNYESRSVHSKGIIKWQGHEVFIGDALTGERIGLVEIADGVWSVYFSTIEIGRYDARTRKVT